MADNDDAGRRADRGGQALLAHDRDDVLQHGAPPGFPWQQMVGGYSSAFLNAGRRPGTQEGGCASGLRAPARRVSFGNCAADQADIPCARRHWLLPMRSQSGYREAVDASDGRVAEWFKAPVLKTGRGFTLPRGFESHPFRQFRRNGEQDAVSRPDGTTGWCRPAPGRGAHIVAAPGILHWPRRCRAPIRPSRHRRRGIPTLMPPRRPPKAEKLPEQAKPGSVPYCGPPAFLDCPSRMIVQFPACLLGNRHPST